ncbi:hypothetical protein DPMN_124365 [Dreissena polymorpha]|uniref:Uncharacterized protein n=1 Tax=Dreissena polymorpha TaxID=45954 RepID=A0A9D4GW82_DREPO|nr:hypothetical protein DPMN_124365 [Dreissena polymorpha]
MPLLQLQRLLSLLPPESCELSAEDYVGVDADEPTGHQLQDKDILSMLSDET